MSTKSLFVNSYLRIFLIRRISRDREGAKTEGKEPVFGFFPSRFLPVFAPSRALLCIGARTV
jgi:hypothetical protein